MPTSTASLLCVLPKLDAPFPQADGVSLAPEHLPYQSPSHSVHKSPPLNPAPAGRCTVIQELGDKAHIHLHEVPAARPLCPHEGHLGWVVSEGSHIQPSPACSLNPAADRPCSRGAQLCELGVRAGVQPRAHLPPSASF